MENSIIQKSEARIQGECVQWFSKAYKDQKGMLFSVHNNAVDIVKGNIALALGRIKGVSDLIYISPTGVCFIEMKTPQGTQQPEQREWEQKIKRRGYKYFIVRSLEEFKLLIDALNS